MSYNPFANVYRRHTKLQYILEDGWSRGFEPEQTLQEASAAGYARCVVKPLLQITWDRLDAEFQEYQFSGFPDDGWPADEDLCDDSADLCLEAYQ